MKQKFTLLLLLVLFSFSIKAQTQIYVLDFESAGGYTTSDPEFTDGGGDYFIRTDGSDIGTFVEFTDIQGSYYFAVMDTDGTPGTYTNTTLNITDIDITGYSNLEIRIYLAEDQSTDGNEDWDDDTYVHITGSIDGGASEDLIWIEAEGGINTLPRIDTDFDGFGDGTEITPAFIQFSSNISGTGALLDIAIEFNQLTSSDEDIAIDHIEIYGTGGPTSGGPICAEAVTVTEGTHHATHTATDDYDQWYVFTATVNGTITVENCTSGYGGDTYLMIIENNCSGANWDEADDVCGTLETLTFDVTAGEVYYIAWGDYDTGTPGEYDWTLTETSVSGGATCGAALSITEGTHYAAHTATDDYDQWYVFTATVNGTITAENCTSGYGGDTYLMIIENNCSGTNWDEADDVCGTLETLTFDVTAGEVYYIAWGDYDTGTPGEYDWTLTETEIISAVITNAYAISDTEIDVIYDITVTTVDPADYNLTGSQSVTFTTATIDGGNDHLVHLSGASENMTGDAVLDNINDTGNITSFDFYAGITPVMYTNNANAPDTLLQGYNATFTGIISANDAYNNVWIADAEGSMNGAMIFDYSFDGLVAVGDEVTIVAQKEIYYDLTEIVDPVLISTLSSGNTPYGPSVIQGNAIDTLEVADSPNAEQWEGQLVTVNNAVITEADVSTDFYFYATDDCGTTDFKVGDNVDYEFGSVSMNVGSMYNITGVVDFSYGKYRINPRDASDIVEIDLATTIVEEPPTQTPGALIDAMNIDSLSAAEVFRFVITDTGDDGLPTKVSQVTVYGGPSNNADFDGVVAGGYIAFAGGDTINYTGQPVLTSNMIQLPMNSDEMVIADGTSEEFVSYIWIDQIVKEVYDLQFMIDADNHGFITEDVCNSSQFASTFTADIIGNVFLADLGGNVNTISENTISIHPNPAVNILNINNMINISDISIVNLLGQTVQTLEVNSENAVINISKLNKGMYIMNFTSYTGEVFSQTFIKQ